MGRLLALLYGIVAYLIFFVTFLYTIGFVGNIGVPKGIDTDPTGQFAQSMIINVALLGLFAVQHSVMARLGFKAWWARIVPTPIERSTYVLISSLILLLLFREWRPMTGVIWNIENPLVSTVLWGLFWLGFGLVLVSSFIIDHFDLFGLRQVVLYFQKKPYPLPQFKVNSLYRFVRHPLLLGFIIAFWSTPVMTEGHLVFALATTAYVLIGIQFEERDLVTAHGGPYVEYRRQVGMLVPTSKAK